MALTDIVQDRTQVFADGVAKYRIITSCTAKGDLPQTQIFLFEIHDSTDPTKDEFKRIANPVDLETYGIDRTVAVSGDGLYLSSTFMVLYDDIDTAVQAKDAVSSRIDQLINTWVTYKDSFYGLGILTSHPTGDPEFIQSLKDAYSIAKNARIAAEAAVASATAAATLAQTEANNAAALVQIYEKEKQLCADVTQGSWATFKTLVENLIAIVGPAASNLITTYPGNADAIGIRSTVTTFADGDPSKTSTQNALSTFCGQAASSYAQAVNAKSAKDLAVATASTNKTKAEADLASAQTAEDAALMRVMEVCPDFDPNSV